MIETKLIEECRDGNLNSFRLLINSTMPFIYAVAFRMLGDEDLAKDVVQESLITIWQKINRIKSPGAYKSWIYRIVINKCYDHLRLKKKNPEFYPDSQNWSILSDKFAAEASSELENSEISGIIRVLTNRLSPKQKAVFILSETEQMSNDEISEIMGMSKTSVKANLHHAKKSISEMIKNIYRDGFRK